MSRGMRLALRQVRYEHRAFMRNPAAAFFTLVFPVLFLVIFNLLFGNQELTLDGGTARVSNFYVPSIGAFSIINACYTSLAMGVVMARDHGQLKRIGGTPLPKAAYVVGKVGYLVLVAAALFALVTLFGALFYDVDIPTRTLPAVIVALALGAATFSLLALGMSGFVPNADAAPAVVNGTILPLLFISDVFIPFDEDAPRWLTSLADLFPVKHLSAALQAGFDPFQQGGGWAPGHLAVLAAWAVAAAILAHRRFSWEPRV